MGMAVSLLPTVITDNQAHPVYFKAQLSSLQLPYPAEQEHLHVQSLA